MNPPDSFKLHFACSYPPRFANITQLVTTKPWLLGSVDSALRTPLIYATRLDGEDAVQTVKYLYRVQWNLQGRMIHPVYKPDSIDYQDNAGSTALHYACRSKNYDLVRILVDLGINLLLVDSMGHTALFYVDGPDRTARKIWTYIAQRLPQVQGLKAPLRACPPPIRQYFTNEFICSTDGQPPTVHPNDEGNDVNMVMAREPSMLKRALETKTSPPQLVPRHTNTTGKEQYLLFPNSRPSSPIVIDNFVDQKKPHQEIDMDFVNIPSLGNIENRDRGGHV